MSRERWRTVVPALALAAGSVLLVVTLLHTDLPSMGALSWQLGAALPLALLPGAAWHILRTAAWQRCFPRPEAPGFGRLFRVRLAAEAFSFVTIRGVAGEPLKVALLPEVPAATASAAVALERVAYVVATLVIVGGAAGAAMAALPLSREWFRVFRVLAIAAALLVIGLAVLLVRRAPAEDARPSHHREGSSRVRRALGRFARELQRRWRELAYGDRRRLLALLALEAASYVMMALEVWVVLWAMRVPISAAGAMAIETVTRVASMLSAFVPGGIGVLEASNVAAAAAVAASGGGAALAIVRRLRGLIWCVAGFAVAPGLRTQPARAAGPSTPADREKPIGPVFRTLVAIDDGPAEVRVPLSSPLGGLPIAERIVRAAAHDGYRRLLVWSPARSTEWSGALAALGAPIDAVVVSDPREWREHRRQLPADAYDAQLVPQSREALAAAEARLRRSIVKPTDGTLARFNRRLSIPISVQLIRWTRLSANAMSLLVLALGLCAGWLFARGDYASGVAAAALSLAAGILDGCDGELARLQYQSSAFGCWLDTLGDYAYYLVTFAGLTVGAVRSTGQDAWWWIGGALLAGTVLTFWLLILLRQRATGGRPERLHARTRAHFEAGAAWKRLAAKLSFTATRAAMPYGILAFALAGLLPVVLVLATVAAHVYWISLAVELRRLLPAGDGAGHGTEAATV